jgi:hypothetical protein
MHIALEIVAWFAIGLLLAVARVLAAWLVAD